MKIFESNSKIRGIMMKSKRQSNKKFDERYEHFSNELKCEREQSYLGLDKNYEQMYLKQHRYRLNEIFLSLPYSKDQVKILDIGTTPFTFFIKKFYKHYDISTIDITNLMKERCEKNSITYRRCNLMMDKIPFENDSFDVVIFTEVFEHLFVEPSKVFNELSRILKKNGILIFGTPNYASLINRIKLLFGINPQAPMENMAKTEWVHGHGHVREYTMRECISILRNNGFLIKEASFKSYWDRWDLRCIQSEPKQSKSYTMFLPLVFIYDLVYRVIPPFRGGIHIVAMNDGLD